MAEGIEELKSKQNPLIKEIRAALRSGGLTPRGLLPIEGPMLLKEAFKSNIRLDCLLFRDRSLIEDVVWQWLQDQRTRLFQAGQELLASVTDTETPAGVVALAHWSDSDIEALLDEPRGLFLALMGLQDPGNLGTIIRSAEAFGVTAILATSKTVSAFNPKSVRASAGSIFRIPVFQNLGEQSLFQKFKSRNVMTVATSLKSVHSVDAAALRLPLALFIGQEAKGLPEAVIASCQQQIRIPTSDSVQSLNAAIAAGILLYEIRKHEPTH